jgi:hypothetical protein
MWIYMGVYFFVAVSTFISVAIDFDNPKFSDINIGPKLVGALLISSLWPITIMVIIISRLLNSGE